MQDMLKAQVYFTKFNNKFKNETNTEMKINNGEPAKYRPSNRIPASSLHTIKLSNLKYNLEPEFDIVQKHL